MKKWLLALAGLLASASTHVCAQAGPPGYPTITAAQVQPTGDMVQLYGTRFVYNTFLTMQQLSAFVALQDGSVGAGTAGQIPFYAAAGSALTAQGPFAAGASIIGAGTSGLAAVGPFTAGLPMIGNGSSGLATGTKSGTTNQFVTGSGTTPVNGDCASWNGGNAIDAGAPCGSGSSGSGTVTAGTLGQIAAYPSNGTTVAGINVVPSKNGGIGCVTLEEFGGGPGIANVSAFAAAVASFGTNSGCISFGPGTYNFAASPGLVYSGLNQSLSLYGAGQDVTNLNFAGNGISLAPTAQGSFHIHDLTLLTSAHDSGIAFKVINNNVQVAYPSQNELQNVTIRGLTYGVGSTQCFDNAILLSGVSNINLINVDLYGCVTGSPTNAGTGTGLIFQGLPGSGQFSVVLNISNSFIEGFSTGIQEGNFVQGVTISNSNINFNTVGFQTPAGLTGSPGQLSITNSQFSNYSNSIVMGSPIPAFTVSNSLFIIFPSSAGIDCGLCASGSFIGNSFVGNNQTGTIGIAVGAVSSPLVMSGNTFFNLATGIQISSATARCNIYGNSYLTVTATVINNGCTLAAPGQ